MITLLNKLQDALDWFKHFDFLGPLAIRIYLAPIFILAGINKLSNVENVTYWFESLGIPLPELMVYLAGGVELLGGIALLIGLATRWFAIPLMITMVVAAATAHWEQGWHVLPESELTAPWEWRTDLIEGANERKQAANNILQRHGNYSWLTETGSFTVLKNGIEFAATYFIMLLVLFFTGAGRCLSVDDWIYRKFREQSSG